MCYYTSKTNCGRPTFHHLTWNCIVMYLMWLFNTAFKMICANVGSWAELRISTKCISYYFIRTSHDFILDFKYVINKANGFIIWRHAGFFIVFEFCVFTHTGSCGGSRAVYYICIVLQLQCPWDHAGCINCSAETSYHLWQFYNGRGSLFSGYLLWWWCCNSRVFIYKVCMFIYWCDNTVCIHALSLYNNSLCLVFVPWLCPIVVMSQ